MQRRIRVIGSLLTFATLFLATSFTQVGKEVTTADSIAELKRLVEEAVEKDEFSGSVLLARDGEVLFQGAYGLASKRFDVPNAVDTKFNLGSMNKMFTCVAVMQLVQNGKLSPTDTIDRFLDESWIAPNLAKKIQVQHLMSHTSGLGSYFNEEYFTSSRAMFKQLDDYKRLVYQDALAFEPGTHYSYSNTGMFLLGPIIEKASGENYFEYVLEHICKPAGMINTDCFEMDRPVKNLAIGYTREDGAWANNLYMHVIKGGPAGGGFSTVVDLLAFDQALRNLELLEQEYVELLWRSKPELGSREYGFGFGIEGTPDNRIVGHSGGFPGINSDLDMYLDSGFTMAIMSNYDGGATEIANKMQRVLSRVVD